jgi:hypothetical protein
LSGPIPALEGLNPDDIFAILDLSGLLPGTHVVTPRIALPVGITEGGVLPETVEVVITAPEEEAPTPEVPAPEAPTVDGAESSTPESATPAAATPSATSAPLVPEMPTRAASATATATLPAELEGSATPESP